MATKTKKEEEVAVEAVETVEETVETETAEEEFDAEAYFNERVPFYAFKDNDKYKDDIVVGVNGKMFRIKRGVQVMIPRNVYNVLMRSMAQDAHTANMISDLSSKFAEESRRWQ